MRPHVEPSQPEIEPTSPKALDQGSRPPGHAGLCFAGTSPKVKGALVIHGLKVRRLESAVTAPGSGVGQTDLVKPSMSSGHELESSESIPAVV